jgi:tellurite resistance protein TehA-like permease
MASAARTAVEDATIALWSLATLAILPLAALEIRRDRDPARLRYTTARWAMVFPLGMYGACTHALAARLSSGGLQTLGDVATWTAFAAWALTALAMASAARSWLR